MTDEATIDPNGVYPKMLYRSGTDDSELIVEGQHLDTLVVRDEDEELAALEDRWRVNVLALDHDGDNRKGGSKPRAKAEPVDA